MFATRVSSLALTWLVYSLQWGARGSAISGRRVFKAESHSHTTTSFLQTCTFAGVRKHPRSFARGNWLSLQKLHKQLLYHLIIVMHCEEGVMGFANGQHSWLNISLTDSNCWQGWPQASKMVALVKNGVTLAATFPAGSGSYESNHWFTYMLGKGWYWVGRVCKVNILTMFILLFIYINSQFMIPVLMVILRSKGRRGPIIAVKRMVIHGDQE